MEFIKQTTPTKIPFLELNFNLFKTSTPQAQSHQVSLNKTSSRLSSSVLASTNKLKPKVNFHNIEDLINNSNSYSGNVTNNDSGYHSSDVTLDTTNKTQIINSIIEMIDAQKLAKQFPQYEDREENFSKENNKNSNKKYRTAFNDKQKHALEQYFKRNLYPNSLEIEELSKKLGLGEYVIKVWFQNKRSRSKNKQQF